MQRIRSQGKRLTEKLTQTDLQKHVGWVKGAVKLFISFAVSYLLGCAELPLSVKPLGVAWIFCGNGEWLPSLLGSLLAGFLHTDAPLVYGCTYVAASLIRLFLGILKTSGTEKAIGDFSGFCVAGASVTIFFLSVYRVILGNFRFYDWIASAFATAVGTVAAWIFSHCEDASGFWKSFSQTVLTVSVVLGAKNAVPLPYFQESVALFFILWISREKGWRFGIVNATLLGVVCNLVFCRHF